MPRFLPNDTPAAQASFATVERFLTTDTDVAYGHTSSINEEALKEAYENVRSQHAPPVVSGTDLLSQIESTLRIIPFGCKSIDDMLEGGFREGQVSEIYGDSGSGKTQLCMMACARAAARKARILYIDTSNAFSCTRLVAMLKVIPQATDASIFHLEEAVERVSVVRAYTAHTALAALDALLQQNSSESSRYSNTRPNLVIFDSIGAVIAPVLGAHVQGHALLAAAGLLLKQVAVQLNAAVLVTNHMVGGGGGDWDKGRAVGGAGSSRLAASTFNEHEVKKPALGESWNHQCHCRVQLSLPPSEGHPWTAVVRASTMLAPGKMVAEYWLTSAGASAVPPAAS